MLPYMSAFKKFKNLGCLVREGIGARDMYLQSLTVPKCEDSLFSLPPLRLTFHLLPFLLSAFRFASHFASHSLPCIYISCFTVVFASKKSTSLPIGNIAGTVVGLTCYSVTCILNPHIHVHRATGHIYCGKRSKDLQNTLGRIPKDGARIFSRTL